MHNDIICTFPDRTALDLLKKRLDLRELCTEIQGKIEKLVLKTLPCYIILTHWRNLYFSNYHFYAYYPNDMTESFITILNVSNKVSSCKLGSSLHSIKYLIFDTYYTIIRNKNYILLIHF